MLILKEYNLSLMFFHNIVHSFHNLTHSTPCYPMEYCVLNYENCVLYYEKSCSYRINSLPYCFYSPFEERHFTVVKNSFCAEGEIFVKYHLVQDLFEILAPRS